MSTAMRRPGSMAGRNVRNRLDAYAPQPPTCATQNQVREEAGLMAPTYFFFGSTLKILLMIRHSPFVLSSDM